MSYFGDVLKFEKFNLHDIAQKLKKNPERLALGALDPFSSNIWGKVLGKNYEPAVDQFGGAYGGAPITLGDTGQGVYGRARAAGVPTGPGSQMHDIAHAITALFAGGYGASQLPGGAGGFQFPGLPQQPQQPQQNDPNEFYQMLRLHELQQQQEEAQRQQTQQRQLAMAGLLRQNA